MQITFEKFYPNVMVTFMIGDCFTSDSVAIIEVTRSILTSLATLRT